MKELIYNIFCLLKVTKRLFLFCRNLNSFYRPSLITQHRFKTFLLYFFYDDKSNFEEDTQNEGKK